MADVLTTPTTPSIPAPGTTPQTGGLNYQDYIRKIQKTAAKTRNVQTPDISMAEKTAREMAADPYARHAGKLSQSLISQFGAETTATKRRAEKAATALEITGEASINYARNLERIQGTIRNQVQSASDSFSAAAEKADEYVKAARGRVTEVLSKLDDTFKDIQTTRDFSKAHAMQASVQSVIGSMKAEERNIAETYGTESKEYAQFQQSKMTSLATVQSNIHASYAQLEEQQKTNYLNAVSDSHTKSNMYLGFQEQQHVEMLKYRDDNRAAYAIKGAELESTLEQMKMNGMENLANWIIETPTFTMDATPLVSAINEMNQAASATWVGYEAAKSGKGGGIDWGSMAGTAVGALAGGVGAKAGGAVGSALFKKKE